MKNQKNSSSEISKKELENRVAELENELSTLKKKSKKSKSSIFRKMSVWFLVFLCAVTLNLSIAAAWLKANIIDTETWASKTSEIMKDEDFQNQLSSRITDDIFESTDIEQAIKEFVPPKAEALSEPLTQSLKSYTNEQVISIIKSDKFQTFWYDLNFSAHAGIISSIENGGEKPDDTSSYVIYIDDEKLLLNLSPVLKRVQSNLSERGLSFVDNLTLERANKTVTLTEIDNMPAILNAFNILNKGAIFLFVISIVSGGAAIALAIDKRKTIMALSALTVILMILNIQSIYFARAPLVNQVGESLQSSNSAAAASVFDIITNDLITYNRVMATISAIIFLTAVMSGPSRLAKYLRKKIASLTSNKNNKFLNNLENNATTYVGILGIIYAGLALLGMLKNITFAIIILVIFCLTSFWLLSIRKE